MRRDASSSSRERRNADLFLADLLGRPAARRAGSAEAFTDGFGTHNHVSFCANCHAAGLLANRPDSARLICVYGPKQPRSDTESDADTRTAIAGLLRVSAASLRVLHDSSDMTSRSMVNDVIPALASRPVVFLRRHVPHDLIPTRFTPLLLRTAAS
jgi:hypothetical protein